MGMLRTAACLAVTFKAEDRCSAKGLPKPPLHPVPSNKCSLREELFQSSRSRRETMAMCSSEAVQASGGKPSACSHSAGKPADQTLVTQQA